MAKWPSENEEKPTTSVTDCSSKDLNLNNNTTVSGSTSSSANQNSPVAMDTGRKEEQPSTSSMKVPIHQETFTSGNLLYVIKF